MTPTEFFDKIIAQKEKAHDLLHESKVYDIRRGMGHSISGFVEDLFATYVANNLERKDLIFFVDKVTSFRLDGVLKSKSIKPDLLILKDTGLSSKEKIATHYYDLKTDIGYGRDMKERLQHWNDLILSVRGKNGWITVNGQHEFDIQFTQTIKYSVVIVFDWNVNKQILEENIAFAKNLPGIELYVLLNETEKKINVNENEFNRLLTDCRNYL